MKRDEIWLINLDPSVGVEIKKPGQQSLSRAIIWVFFREE